MTKQERYKELRQQGRLLIDCAPSNELDLPRKLIASIDKQANIWLYCSRCHREHRLSWKKIRAIREQWEREHGQESESEDVAALREIVRELSGLVVSDKMSELVALQVRARKLLNMERGVKDINENRE
ncbi:MAG TPA: hypothetical protein VEL31_21565 [Ktedonobacteraceae bacterium]|nr:hypothetical protein [Ktedonobacteraceae bacterium]